MVAVGHLEYTSITMVYFAVSDRTRQLYFKQETIKIILQFDMHKWRTDFSLVLCIIHVWTASHLLIINIHVTEPHRECTLIVRHANTNFRNAILNTKQGVSNENKEKNPKNSKKKLYTCNYA